MKYLVLGGGSMGINIALELLNQNHKVDIITDTFNSTSFNYATGYKKKHIQILNKNNPLYEFTKFNVMWLLLFILNIVSYNHYKFKFIRKSLEILKKYHITPRECNDTFQLKGQYVLEKLISVLKNHKNATIIYKKIKKADISQYSKDYDNVFVCFGNYSNKHFYCEHIAGYKITIDSDIKPACLEIENNMFVSRTHDNNLVVSGGYYVGDSSHQFNFNKINKQIQTLFLWDKYKCKKILKIEKDIRSTSVDMFPFYTQKNNIIYIRGGSFIGATIAPYVCQNIIYKLNNKPYDYDFSVDRLNKKTIFLLVMFIFIILFIYFIMF